MNGNGELTETENVIFYVSYGVFTEFLRTFATENGLTARIRNAGNQAFLSRNEHKDFRFSEHLSCTKHEIIIVDSCRYNSVYLCYSLYALYRSALRSYNIVM